MVRAFAEAHLETYWYFADDDETLLEAIKAWGKNSPIRVSIQADQVYGAATLEDIKVFDLLQISAGEDDETDSDSEEGSGVGLPTVYLLLTSPRGMCSLMTNTRILSANGLVNVAGCSLKLGNFEIGRMQTDVDLGSNGNYEIAKGWLSNCLHDHQHCPSADPHLLPSRVIDVGSIDATNCRLLIPGNSIRGHYVTLSHCWGGQIDCVLTKETVADFQNSLPWDKLAANFQDAIIIVRKLGLRYLWIDSLCIIQDLREDWVRESAKMADIYRNSLVTISATASPASGHGILRNPVQSATLPDQETRIPLSENDQELYVSLLPTGDRIKEEDLRNLYIYAPLSMRGWCLQETVLSPRILFYGNSRIYWKCTHGFKSADGVYPGSKMPSPSSMFSALSSILFSNHIDYKLDKNAILKEYYELVHEFSGRQLTVHTDKFPALSGLVQRIHSALGGEYLAGLWSSSIRRGLLWEKERRWAKHAVPYRAPSWSWAVTDDLVHFLDTKSSDTDPDNLRLVEYNIQAKDKENPYGEVISAYLVVCGLTIELCRTFEVVDPSDVECGTNFGAPMWDEPAFEGDDEIVDKIISWRVFEIEERGMGRQQFRLVEMAEKSRFFNEMDGHTKGVEKVPPMKYTALLVDKFGPSEGFAIEGGQCLVLKKVGEPSVYRRAGLLTLGSYPVARYCNWMVKTLKIV